MDVKRAIVSALVSGLLTYPGVGFTQAGGPDVFRDKANNAAAGRIFSASSGINEMTGRDGVNDNNIAISGAGEAPAFCTGSECPGVVTALPTPHAGTMQRAVTVPGPMRQFAEGIQGNAYMNQAYQFLSAAWTVADITMNYLDSGVFGGANSSYMKNAMSLGNRHAALNTFFRQLDFSPKIKDVVATGVLGCMQKAQTNGQTLTGASDQCLEDVPVVTGAGFEQSGGANGQGAAAAWFQTHPDQTQAGGNSTSIRLTDLLLAPILHQLGASSASPNDGTDAIRSSWIDKFGDKLFEIPTSAPGGVKIIKETIQPPGRSPAKYATDIHALVWTSLHELMRGYCEYFKSNMSERANTHLPFSYRFVWAWPPIAPADKDFWGNLDKRYNGAPGPTANTYITLTTSTFEFTPVVGDALFSLFLTTQDLKITSGGGGGGISSPNDLQCDMLKSSSTADASNYQKIAKEPSKYVREWRKLYNQLVTLIAAGKRYDVYMQAKRWVDQQTASSSDGDMIREHAYGLIRSASSPFDSPEAGQSVIAEGVAKFISELNRRKQGETGGLGYQIAKSLTKNGQAGDGS